MEDQIAQHEQKGPRLKGVFQRLSHPYVFERAADGWKVCGPDSTPSSIVVANFSPSLLTVCGDRQ